MAVSELVRTETRTPRRARRPGLSPLGSSGASLHTKAFAVDGRLIFVGSFNFDHRSADLNTEMGTFVEDPRLADQLAQEFARLVDPARSWQVSLENGRLAWSNHVDGRRVTLHREPDAGLGRRVIAQLLGWLPIEPQL